MVITPRSVRSCFPAFPAFVLAAGLAACLAAAPAAAQVVDNKGREFLMAFLENADTPLGVELHLTADVATSVTVQYPAVNPTFTQVVPVTPGQVTIVALPIAAAQSWAKDAIGNNLVRASASEEFVAYMVNRAGQTSDAAVALPVDALNSEYIVADYIPNVISSYPAEFVVVAAFDGTTVTITPTSALVGHPAGVPFDVSLNRGQAYYASSAFVDEISGSLTGTTISANRPVGLTNGVRCTNVPTGVSFCDHVFEVAQPVQSWGTRVLVANLPDRPNGTVYRIIASQDATTVSQDGVALSPVLQRGQFIETAPLAGSHVFSAAPDKPIFVVQYMTGGLSPGATQGDPAMGNMVPTGQYLSRYTFATLPASQFPSQFLTVIADDNDLATITLDGVPIGAQAFSAIGSTGFSAAVLTLAAGNHNTASTRPHGITVEGYGSADSYIFPGGAQFEIIAATGDANPPICALAQVEPGSFDGTARDDRPSEDANGNRELDPGEDLNGNGEIDKDTGILSVELLEGAVNLSLTVDPEFLPKDPSVSFQVQATDSSQDFTGSVRVRDGNGNACELSIGLDFPGMTFTDWAEDVEVNVEFIPEEEREVRTAYLALQAEGVKILDVSDPNAITTLGSYAPETCQNGSSTAAFFADDVEYVDELDALFVSAGRCGVLVLDVSNPADPVLLGRYDTPVWAEAVEIDLSSESVIGYIADHTGGLVIVDFDGLFASSPSAPVRLGGIGSSATDWGTGAAIDVALFDSEGGLLAYVATAQGLRVVDVTPPASPQLIGSYDTNPTGTPPEVPQDVTLSDDGNTAYIGGWQAALLAIDVSDPSEPSLADEVPATKGFAYYESEVDGFFVYANEGKLGLRMFARGDGPLDPIEGEQPIPIADGNGWAWDVQVVGGVAYVTYGILEDGTGGLAVIELAPSDLQIDGLGGGGPDGDGDGTPDSQDNCLNLANPSQADVNQDGFGDACDADYDDDGGVGIADFGVLSAAFGTQPGQPGWNAEVDHDGDGVIALLDFGFFRSRLGTLAGPSGLACAGVAPCP